MTSPSLDQKALAAALDAVAKLHARMAVERKLPGYSLIIPEAISSFLAALPAPEPVAWLASARKGGGMMVDLSKDRLQEDAQLYSPTCFGGYDLRPLYASPPSHQGLREALAELVKNAPSQRYDVSAQSGEGWAYSTALQRARAALQSQPAPSGETK